MTVCVAALSTDGIVCVADKALTFGGYIQWDADCIKLIPLHGQAISMNSSGSEVDFTRVMRGLWEITDYRCHRYELIKKLKNKFRESYEDMQTSEILVPHMLSGVMVWR
jgi:hypothetical protein